MSIVINRSLCRALPEVPRSHRVGRDASFHRRTRRTKHTRHRGDGLLCAVKRLQLHARGVCCGCPRQPADIQRGRSQHCVCVKIERQAESDGVIRIVSRDRTDHEPIDNPALGVAQSHLHANAHRPAPTPASLARRGSPAAHRSPAPAQTHTPAGPPYGNHPHHASPTHCAKAPPPTPVASHTAQPRAARPCASHNPSTTTSQQSPRRQRSTEPVHFVMASCRGFRNVGPPPTRSIQISAVHQSLCVGDFYRGRILRPLCPKTIRNASLLSMAQIFSTSARPRLDTK